MFRRNLPPTPSSDFPNKIGPWPPPAETVLMVQGGEFQSVLKKQNRSTQNFVPGLRHASFALKCEHVRMLKNAMRVDLSRQMEKSANQHACIPFWQS